MPSLVGTQILRSGLNLMLHAALQIAELTLFRKWVESPIESFFGF